MSKKKEAKPAKGNEPEAQEGAEGAEGAEAPKKKLAGKKLVLFVILPAILVLGAGGGAAALLLSGPKAQADAHGEEAKTKDKKEKAKKGGKDKGGHGGAAGEEGEGAIVITEGEGVYFVALPEMLVNIASTDGQPALLKLQLTLEAADEDVLHALEPELPRIQDQFQSFLRELRTDDMAGSGGAHRVRAELMRRVNLVIAPARINAVLIEEMLIQ
ncbi:MAG: flagellar basal body-associated FliL family protein [Caulobacterales bacterium]